MKSTQSDHNMNFDGMEVIAPKQGNAYRGNQYAGKTDPNKTINYGRGHTRGNDGSCGHSGFSSEGKRPPASAVPTLPAQGSTRDSINRGGQVRNPGGTRTFDPKAGQNYKGNADKINVGRGPTKGNKQ